MAMHVGEAEVAAFVFEDEFFVIDAEKVQRGGVEVVDVERINGGSESEGVGFSVGDAAFDAAAGEEHGAGLGVMVAATALRHRGASELTAPDDEGVVEEAALF